MKSALGTFKHIKGKLRLPRREQNCPERDYTAMLYEKLKAVE